MAKLKKKRRKHYQGQDAALAQPVVTKIQAANRTKLSQWWFDHKKAAKPILIVAGVILFIILIIIEIIRLANS